MKSTTTANKDEEELSGHFMPDEVRTKKTEMCEKKIPTKCKTTNLFTNYAKTNKKA